MSLVAVLDVEPFSEGQILSSTLAPPPHSIEARGWRLKARIDKILTSNY